MRKKLAIAGIGLLVAVRAARAGDRSFTAFDSGAWPERWLLWLGNV